ncbi:unnamed protein product [Rotaria sp. Silwood2]|nr:unnamed protein product [Rotaria sp. Silwood2]CAF3148209.1 unnamed protein product [Rotaria sp. Silwood2]CAF3376001.1 unnamed protein product [Rotaria sp. Silwood2]CAF4333854.1 unnamed protein product [Rotaria sp. Silwood2]CAF4477427.1 unnamed protein product [Rotaria sp. Silwood2]
MKFDNEILRSHDELLDQIQVLEKSNHLSWNLFAQIEQWKKTTINKVEIAAERDRLELTKLINKQRIAITKQPKAITKEVRRHREEENFVENDINQLQAKLQETQRTIEQFIQKDTSETLIVDNDQINWNRIIYIREDQQNCKYIEPNV